MRAYHADPDSHQMHLTSPPDYANTAAHPQSATSLSPMAAGPPRQGMSLIDVGALPVLPGNVAVAVNWASGETFVTFKYTSQQLPMMVIPSSLMQASVPTAQPINKEGAASRGPSRPSLDTPQPIRSKDASVDTLHTGQPGCRHPQCDRSPTVPHLPRAVRAPGDSPMPDALPAQKTVPQAAHGINSLSNTGTPAEQNARGDQHRADGGATQSAGSAHTTRANDVGGAAPQTKPNVEVPNALAAPTASKVKKPPRVDPADPIPEFLKQEKEKKKLRIYTRREHKIYGTDRLTAWYRSGSHTASVRDAPPPHAELKPRPAPGDLFVHHHAPARGKRQRVWIYEVAPAADGGKGGGLRLLREPRRREGVWREAFVPGEPHPSADMDGYVLHLLDDGRPRWVKQTSADLYARRTRTRERARGEW